MHNNDKHNWNYIYFYAKLCAIRCIDWRTKSSRDLVCTPARKFAFDLKSKSSYQGIELNSAKIINVVSNRSAIIEAQTIAKPDLLTHGDTRLIAGRRVVMRRRCDKGFKNGHLFTDRRDRLTEWHAIILCSWLAPGGIIVLIQYGLHIIPRSNGCHVQLLQHSLSLLHTHCSLAGIRRNVWTGLKRQKNTNTLQNTHKICVT